MKRSLAFVIGMISFCAQAQLEVPSRLALDGPNATDRQVTGLDDPISEDAGMSLNAARNGSSSTAYASGAEVLIAALDPPLSAYGVGLLISLIPDAPNAAGAQLDLNGLGPRPILKWGAVPLDSADLIPGAPFRVVYDGVAFQLLGQVTLPCPDGFSAVTSRLCIMDNSLAPVSFFAATNVCGAMNARLCSFSEWAYACRSKPAFLATVLELEWVDDAANSDTNAKNVGVDSTTLEFGCEFGANSLAVNPGRFRCCKTR